MTRRPDPCHYDRTLKARVTKRHTPACQTNTCEGCAPCTQPHCLVCGTRHTTPSEPDTCGRCIRTIRDDLNDIRNAYRDLHQEALDAGGDGRLAAAAPIPGGTAQVLIGPSVRLDLLRITSRGLEDHHKHDPIPPLAILAQWEDIYRTWLDHPTTKRATLGAALDYLTTQLDYLANHATTPGAPDWLAFTRQIQRLRARLDLALHDEREPEMGVACFNCGDKLVRRFRRPTRCRHTTPARVELRTRLEQHQAAQAWMQVLATYPELGPPRFDEIAPTHIPARLVAAAQAPCPDCAAAGQGGIDDPTVGQSWECPGCRKQYDPGEYARAIRLSTTMDGDGWTHVTMAADAAATLTGHPVPIATVRKWMDRGKVASLCLWRPGATWGQRLVLYPDVADMALQAVARQARRRSRTA